jgi:hypothetical protein
MLSVFNIDIYEGLPRILLLLRLWTRTDCWTLSHNFLSNTNYREHAILPTSSISGRGSLEFFYCRGFGTVGVFIYCFFLM